MNFLGHAKVALWSAHSPELVLGAMLPDFASMAGVRLRTVEGEALAAGVQLHHRTDDVFHALPTFIALMQDTIDRLTALGVARGPARAVGHIGVELLIDGELAQETSVGNAYLGALDAWLGLPEHALGSTEQAPLQRLARRLVAYGIPYDYERPEAVTARLANILAERPRLALDGAARELVGKTLPYVQGEVKKRLPELLETLARGLAHRRCSSAITG